MTRLTEREKQVLVKLAIGTTTVEIADQLGVREQVVKNHISSILHKLKVRNRVEAVLKTVLGFIPSEEMMENFVESRQFDEQS